MNFVNVDLHCDLLSYFLYPHKGHKEDIGCSLPYLLEGNVRLQVMAIYTSTENGSVEKACRQADFFVELLENPSVFKADNFIISDYQPGRVGILAAIENASGLCGETEDFSTINQNYSQIVSKTGKPAYVGFTHHTENRFGGGNATETGLKEDGKRLLEFLCEMEVPVDFSHTSDALAFDILNYGEQKNLKFRILASHSNSRKVYSHNRNLPSELVQEIIKRDGIIGINFIKDFINPENPKAMYHHISHFLESGAENHLVYGGDFFFDAAHPDKSRYPFFFDEFKNALAYNTINKWIVLNYGLNTMNKISHENALRFLNETQN